MTRSADRSFGTSYPVSWNGDAQLDARTNCRKRRRPISATRRRSQSPARRRAAFTHTVTADTRYYYRVHAAPICGGDFGAYSPTPASSSPRRSRRGSRTSTSRSSPARRRTAPSRSRSSSPASHRAGKTALATGDTFSVSSDKPFMTISPSSGPLPAEGADGHRDDRPVAARGRHRRRPASPSTARPAPAKSARSAIRPRRSTSRSRSASSRRSRRRRRTRTPDSTRCSSPPSRTPTASARASSATSASPTPRRSRSTTSSPTRRTDTDGTSTGKQTTLTVNAGDTKALNDIVKDWYGSGVLGEAPQGSLEIRPLNYAGKDTVSISLATVAASRTYSVAATGTFGQFIPALPLVNFLGQGERLEDLAAAGFAEQRHRRLPHEPRLHRRLGPGRSISWPRCSMMPATQSPNGRTA